MRVRALLLGVVGLGLCTRLLAGVDTLSHPVADRLGVDSISAFYLQSAREQPVWLSMLPDGYNRLVTRASLAAGRFIPAQGSTRVQDYALSAEGKTTWRGLSLHGRFSYGRVLEDSTRLRHQTRINPTAPVYFGSLRYNHYERSVYTFAVAGQRDLWQGGLPLTLALDYRVGEHFSNNDPRGGINDFQLNVLGGLGYRSGRWEYHLTGRYGYGRERMQVAFKNEKYTSNVEDPLYVNWYMNGYGTAVQRISNNQRRYDDGFKRAGIGGHVRLAPGRAGTWQFTSEWLREVQRFKRLDESVQTYTLLDTYTLDRWSAALSASWGQDSARRIVADARAVLLAGSDFEPFFQAKNYTYRREQVDVGVRVSAGRWHYGVRGDYQLLEQQDGVAGVYSAVSSVSGRANGGYVFALPSKRQLRSDVRMGYRYAFDHELVFPALAETPFNTHVIYPDFLYRASSAVQYGLSMSYGFPTVKLGWWEVALQSGYQQRVAQPTIDRPVPSAPRADRWTAQLRVSLFF